MWPLSAAARHAGMLLLALALQGSISAGVGNSYDYAGVRLEARLGHVSLSGAFGVTGLGLVDPDHDGSANKLRDHWPALSLRFFSGDGRGFVAALAWSGHRYDRSYDEPFLSDHTARFDVFTATIGWRFRWDAGWYLELGIGGGQYRTQGHPSLSGNDSTPGPYHTDTQLIPDAVLGAGFEF